MKKGTYHAFRAYSALLFGESGYEEGTYHAYRSYIALLFGNLAKSFAAAEKKLHRAAGT